jgi:hypothetical protein
MKPDDNDQLWEVSPFFARNILRAVRQEEAARPRRSFFARIAGFMRRRAWQSALTATCAVAVLGAVSPSLFVRPHQLQHAEPDGVATQIAANPDYEVITHLDELVADEESSLWLDDSTHDPKVH